MRKANSNAKRAMRLVHTEKISLKEAWQRIKSGKVSKRKTKRRSVKKSFGRRHRKLRSAKNSLKLNRRKLRKRKSRKSRKSRRFGMAAGPGYAGQTSYSNAYAPYFGTAEPYINSSNWWYPVTGGQLQSPQMLMKN